MRKVFIIGGVLAGIVLIVLGVSQIVEGIDGRNEVRDILARENIVGTPDSALKDKPINTGQRAKDFAQVMRKHTLEETGGKVYADMGRFLDDKGKPTSDEKAAAKDPKTGEPTPNPARNIWVTETALATALNVAFFAERVAVFAIVIGIALALAGIGFLVLSLTALRWRAEPS